jgi:phage tail-like protein
MAQINPDAKRLDPYKNFKFRLKWNGEYVAGMSKCSAFMPSSEIGQPHESADLCSDRGLSGRTKYETVTLEQGVTHDTDFEQWANQVRSVEAGPGGDVLRKYHRKNRSL